MNEDLGNPSRTCFVASEIYPRRLNAKEVLITQRDGEFIFPVTDGPAKLSGRNYEFQEPTLRRESTVAENFMTMGMSFTLKKQKMTKESIRIFGLRISFIVIILNREVQLRCREKIHSLIPRFAFLNETPPRRNIRMRWGDWRKAKTSEAKKKFN